MIVFQRVKILWYYNDSGRDQGADLVTRRLLRVHASQAQKVHQAQEKRGTCIRKRN